MSTESERIARMEQKQEDMADDIGDLKKDVKEIRVNLSDLKTDFKVAMAKFGTYLAIGMGIIQIVVEVVLRHFFG